MTTGGVLIAGLLALPNAATAQQSYETVAVVSAQPGKSLVHRRLNAIRVARMEAMRNLTEQIHGVRIDGATTIAEAVLQSDTLRSTVVGMLRAARTVHIQPRGSDTYEVLLEVDRDMVDQLLKVARRET